MNKADSEIKKMWQIIATNDSSVLELRAIWPPAINPSKSPLIRHFSATQLGGVDACKLAFETEALRLNALGYNIYIVMNPITPEFRGIAVTDDDILYRDLLLIDIDRVAKDKIPATDAEIESASQIAEEVITYLESQGWPEPIKVMSGNGHHLYYVMSIMQNNEESKSLVQRLLKSLATKFDNSVVQIDTTVFNASRITKVVGTIARKGPESAGRPYRMARVL